MTLLKELYDLTKSAENDAIASSSLRRSLPTLSAPTARSKGSKKSQKKKDSLYSRTEVPLPTLIVQDFDQDQIWEEIQLQNGLIYDSLVTSISKVLAHKPRVKAESEESEDDESILKDLNASDDNLDEDDLSDFFESDEKYRRKKAKEQVKYSKSIVDDKFFNLAQMTEFVDKMDAAEDAKVSKNESDDPEESDEDDDEKIDYFKADDEDEEEDAEVEYYYKDFFDPPLDEAHTTESSSKKKSGVSEDGEPQRSVRFNLEEEEDELEEDDQETPLEKEQELPDEEEAVDVTTLSSFEKKRRRIEENITAMEEQAMQPKSWQLTGEVTAQTRPENSLLEEHLIYDHLLRQGNWN